MMVLRRVRGLVGIALVWGVALSAIGGAFILAGLASGLISSVPGWGWPEWLTMAGRVAARDFLFGGAVGAAFAMLLTATERRRTVDTLSLSRVAGWGFLASAVPTSVVGMVSGFVISPLALAAGTMAAGFVGIGLSVGMIRLARRSDGALPTGSATSIP